MVRWTFITAIGGCIISCFTLIAASYLAYSLARQGRGKLRVRLLMGMVISDLMLGIVAIVPESVYINNGFGLRTGSPGCNAAAFLLTGVLFTQHMWTLCIALATFLLLKYPLSGATTIMEKYSWTAGPIIFIVSFLHSGIWWAKVGFVNNGSLCYYGSYPIRSGLDARDLVQFIPRALVFIVIVGLYSTLFQFLRRPDTIQLSSQFVSGGTNGHQSSPNKGGVQLPKVLRKFGSGGGKQKAEPVNPEAPWEQLEFVQVGHGRTWGMSPTQSHISQFNGAGSVINGGILINSRPPSPRQPSHSGGPLDENITPASEQRAPSLGRMSSYDSESGPSSGLNSQRPSDTETLVTPELGYSKPLEQPVAPLPTIITSHILSPVLSGGESEFDSKSLRIEGSDDEDENRVGMTTGDQGRRSSGQTLKEFFQEHQVQMDDDPRGSNGAEVGGVRQMSATAYFNRQASLLMLYFPLAYMVVFSISLIRLVYVMVRNTPSPILSLMSSWMVLSVGLIDGLVYGLAEFLVRRRVRRKMPDRM